MKKFGLTCLLIALAACNVQSQGTFLFLNFDHPTRLGTLDGPFAGPDYWGQMLVGPTELNLVPIGPAGRHRDDGTIGGLFVLSVPNIACLETAYIQMVAWDGRLWGSEISNVPENQFGRTDVVPHTLAGGDDPNCPPYPAFAPRFTQPAIVPPIPEPSTVLLGILGGCTLVLCQALRSRFWKILVSPR